MVSLLVRCGPFWPPRTGDGADAAFSTSRGGPAWEQGSAVLPGAVGEWPPGTPPSDLPAPGWGLRRGRRGSSGVGAGRFGGGRWGFGGRRWRLGVSWQGLG